MSQALKSALFNVEKRYDSILLQWVKLEKQILCASRVKGESMRRSDWECFKRLHAVNFKVGSKKHRRFLKLRDRYAYDDYLDYRDTWRRGKIEKALMQAAIDY